MLHMLKVQITIVMLLPSAQAFMYELQTSASITYSPEVARGGKSLTVYSNMLQITLLKLEIKLCGQGTLPIGNSARSQNT